MNPVYNAFVYVVWFLATFYVIYLLLLLIARKEQLYELPKLGKARPMVSIIVPAYNEEAVIEHTIASLKKVTYKNVEFIVISDGSKDNTAKVVRANIKGDKRFKFIDNKHNQGKAGVLNEGIRRAKGEYVAGMDADSMVDPDIIEKVLPYFYEDGVGAVTVAVEVAERKKVLHKIFEIEYIIGLSLFLKVLSWLDALFVTPGPFSMYRKDMLDEIGGFDTNNITEDLEIAYRIQRARYKIRNCLEARVRTFVPPTFKQIYVQRRRWYSGAIQTLVQHRDMLLNSRYGWFAYVMPFNYLLVVLGLTTFLLMIWLALRNLWQVVASFQYTGFDLWQRILQFEIDPLRLGTVNFIGLAGFMSTVILLFIGLNYAKKKYGIRWGGMLMYPVLFFLYQIYWIGSIYNVVRGKKVSWR